MADTLSRAAPSDGPESPSGMTLEYDVFRVDLTQMDLSPNLVKHGTMDQIIEKIVDDIEQRGHAWWLALPKERRTG